MTLSQDGDRASVARKAMVGCCAIAGNSPALAGNRSSGTWGFDQDEDDGGRWDLVRAQIAQP